jgi:hypothetical protein
MAQVCGGSSFDFVASKKHNTAQRVLSRAADVWATRGLEALKLDSVLAVLLHVFLAQKWSQGGGFGEDLRPLESWLSLVSTSQQEAESAFPCHVRSDIPAVLTLLHAELSFAAQQWILGHPEQPPTADALNAIEHILFTYKLTHRPPSPKLPASLISN